MTLAIDISHRLGTFLLDAQFETDSGLVALFGRSGSGKTSIINVIAGLIRPTRGRVTIDGTALVDTECGIFVPRHRRRVGCVFQEGRLFPHLTVRGNLLYGRWFAPGPKRGDELDRVVDLLGIAGLLDRRPGRLSGGEKQRVAIGRALLADPRVLLMDEPLASLDEARKAEILPYIERLRDQSKVPIMHQHDETYGLTELASRAGRWKLHRIAVPVGARLRLRVRARDVMLAKSAPADLSALNVLQGVIADIGAKDGPIVEVRVDCSGQALIARLTRYSVERLGLSPGMPVFALVKSVALDRRSLSGPLQATPEAVLESGDT
jgi:molybdate transport system ATP-binding protein